MFTGADIRADSIWMCSPNTHLDMNAEHQMVRKSMIFSRTR